MPARSSDQGMKTKVIGRVRSMMAEAIARFKKHIALATFGLMTMMKNSGVDSQCFTLVFMKARKQDKMKIRVKFRDMELYTLGRVLILLRQGRWPVHLDYVIAWGRVYRRPSVRSDLPSAGPGDIVTTSIGIALLS